MFLWQFNQILKANDDNKKTNNIEDINTYDGISSKLFQNSDKIISDFVENTEGSKWGRKQLFNSWHDNNAKYVKKFKWTHTLRECERAKNIFTITITESFMDIPTSGGSSFIILQNNAHTRDFCPITDLFNGTYIAKCTLHEDITNIEGTIDFVNFTAFTQLAKPMKRKIFDFSVNISKLQSTTESSTTQFFNGAYNRTNRGKLLAYFLFSLLDSIFVLF